MRSAFGKWRTIPALFQDTAVGDVGWIIAGLVISYCFPGMHRRHCWRMLRHTFTMCAVASLVLGLFKLHAARKRRRGPARTAHAGTRHSGAGCLALLKDRNFLVFFIASILICVPLAFYYQYANLFLTELPRRQRYRKADAGQMSEVLLCC